MRKKTPENIFGQQPHEDQRDPYHNFFSSCENDNGVPVEKKQSNIERSSFFLGSQERLRMRTAWNTLPRSINLKMCDVMSAARIDGKTVPRD